MLALLRRSSVSLLEDRLIIFLLVDVIHRFDCIECYSENLDGLQGL